MTACVAGNPLKAWAGGTEPDDEWEDQTHEFDDLEAAKAFITGLHHQTTTHVVLEHQDETTGEWYTVFNKDGGTNDIGEPAELDQVRTSTADERQALLAAAEPVNEIEVEAPPTMPRQGSAQ